MIIGFCGKKGSGKSFFSDYLVKNFNFIELSYAKPLKEVVKIIFNLSDDDVNDPIKKELKINRLNASPRQLLQWLGTDIIRDEFNKKFNYNGSRWVDLMRENLIKLKGRNIVISDVRFSDEIDLIHQFNGIIINIERNNIDMTNTTNHKSENQDLNYDHKIINKNELTNYNFEFLNQLIN